MKLKKKELLYHEAGKYFLDLSKLVFGGIILAEIMNLAINQVAVFAIGGVAVVALALFGFHYYAKEIEYGTDLFFIVFCATGFLVHTLYRLV